MLLRIPSSTWTWIPLYKDKFDELHGKLEKERDATEKFKAEAAAIDAIKQNLREAMSEVVHLREQVSSLQTKKADLEIKV